MNLKHYDSGGHARFITFCTHRRLPTLTNNRFRTIVVNSIKSAQEKYGFQLIAYVIMPEHVHLVILPGNDMKIGDIIGEIKRISAKQIHELLRKSNSDLIKKLTVIRNRVERFAFWQRRCYDHNCRTEESMWEKVNYCHYNPVKRDLVKAQTNPPDGWGTI